MINKVDELIKTIHEAREMLKNADVKTTNKCTIHKGKGLNIHDIEQRQD